MSLLLNDLTYLKGRNGELVGKGLEAVDSRSNRVSSYVFKRPTFGKMYQCFTLE